MSLSVRVKFYPLKVDLRVIVPLPAAQVLMPPTLPTKVFLDGLKVVKALRLLDT